MIRYLHPDARLSALWVADKHLRDAVDAAAVALSTAVQMLAIERDTELHAPRATKWSDWAMESIEHYTWLESYWLSAQEQLRGVLRQQYDAWVMLLRLKTYLPLLPRAGWTAPADPQAERRDYVAFYLTGTSYNRVRRPWWFDERTIDADAERLNAGAERLRRAARK